MTADVEVRFDADDIDVTLLYQRYYLMGLGRTARLRIRGLPLAACPFPGVDRRVRVASHVRRLRAAMPVRRPTVNSGLTGRYVFRTRIRSTNVAIDARDSSPIHDPDVLEWSDVYFKANAWPGIDYDPRVRPIVNGNGILSWRRIEHLRSLRGRRHDLDVAFVSRLWGGIEHNVRLFEALSRLDRRTVLRAIIPRDANESMLAEPIERLRAVGVPVISEELAPKELWGTLANSRLVVLRPGAHLCVPWRTLDLLAMGACIFLDSPFVPRWPQPLVEGVHYVDGGVRRPEDGSTADPGDYARIPDMVEAALASEEDLQGIRTANAAYFDAHAAPGRVSEYVLREIRERA